MRIVLRRRQSWSTPYSILYIRIITCMSIQKRTFQLRVLYTTAIYASDKDFDFLFCSSVPVHACCTCWKGIIPYMAVCSLAALKQQALSHLSLHDCFITEEELQTVDIVKQRSLQRRPNGKTSDKNTCMLISLANMTVWGKSSHAQQ